MQAWKACELTISPTRQMVAPKVGLEPTTPWLTVRCSNQLSYLGIFNQIKKEPSDVLFLHKCTTVGAEVLNFRVRNGNGCTHLAIITRYSFKTGYIFYTKLSLRSISTGQLNTSPCLHTQPINHVFFMGS